MGRFGVYFGDCDLILARVDRLIYTLITVEARSSDRENGNMSNTETTSYFSAAFSGTTRIPGNDGAPMPTLLAAHNDCVRSDQVRALDNGSERRLTDDEYRHLEHAIVADEWT